MRSDPFWIRWGRGLQSEAAHQAGLALLSGALAMWALPPAPQPWLAVVGFAVWLRLLAGAEGIRSGVWLGWLFGLGHFIPGLAWLWTSLHEFGKIPAAGAVSMIVALAAILALYPALCGALLAGCRIPSSRMAVSAPAVWVGSEWLRAHLFTGFPWNLTGYVWDGSEAVVQIADLGGVYLLSGLTLALAGLVAGLLHTASWRGWRLPVVTLVIGATLLAAAQGYGIWRMREIAAQLARPATPPPKVALVQGNIGQAVKWDPKRQTEWLNRYLDLSATLEQRVDLVVWPETAAAFFLQYSPEHLERIVALSRDLRTPILTGAPMADRDASKEMRYFNSMVWIGPDEYGELRNRYDKHHLVPFGEYIPLRFLFPASIQKLTHGSKDFTSGPGPTLLPSHLGDLGPLICYEVIFPDEVGTLAQSGARWLVNLTNDGWFGEAARPQHLAMARMRAVENRLSMVRVANSGISAGFDPLGRELGRIPSNVMGAVVVEVPDGVGGSLWSRYGAWWIGIWAGWAVLALLLGKGRRRISDAGVAS